MGEIVQQTRRLAPHAAVVTASVVLAVALSLLLQSAAGMAKALWFLGSTWWLSTDPLGPQTPLAWQSAIVLAGVLAWFLAQPSSRTARARAGFSALAGLFAIVLVAQAVLREWAFVVVFGAAVASASWLARRPARPTAGGLHASPRRVLAAVVLAALSQTPSIADWIEEHESQSLPRFRLELVAARAADDDTTMIDFGARDLAWAEGRVWALDGDDALVVSDADVERVRWMEDPEDGRPGITFRFDPEIAQAVRARSIRRVGGYDAIVVDGGVQMVPHIEAVLLDGVLVLHVAPGDRGRLAELYARLTGRAAPSR